MAPPARARHLSLSRLSIAIGIGLAVDVAQVMHFGDLPPERRLATVILAICWVGVSFRVWDVRRRHQPWHRPLYFWEGFLAEQPADRDD